MSFIRAIEVIMLRYNISIVFKAPEWFYFYFQLLLMSGKLNKKGPLYKYMEIFIGPGILTGGNYATTRVDPQKLHYSAVGYNQSKLRF